MENKSIKYISFFTLLFFATIVRAQNKNSDIQYTTEEAVEKPVIVTTTEHTETNKKTKTIEFKIESRKPLTEETGKTIDNLLLSKTGVNAAKTDIQKGITRVTINSNFSEKAVEHLFERVDVDVKILSVTNDTGLK